MTPAPGRLPINGPEVSGPKSQKFGEVPDPKSAAIATDFPCADTPRPVANLPQVGGSSYDAPRPAPAMANLPQLRDDAPRPAPEVNRNIVTVDLDAPRPAPRRDRPADRLRKLREGLGEFNPTDSPPMGGATVGGSKPKPKPGRLPLD